jgi:hypothetical protein
MELSTRSVTGQIATQKTLLAAFLLLLAENLFKGF